MFTWYKSMLNKFSVVHASLLWKEYELRVFSKCDLTGDKKEQEIEDHKEIERLFKEWEVSLLNLQYQYFAKFIQAWMLQEKTTIVCSVVNYNFSVPKAGQNNRPRPVVHWPGYVVEFLTLPGRVLM